MLTIKLLGRFGLGFHANTKDVLQCVKFMLEAKMDEEVFIDFSELEFLYPSGINILVIVGKYLQIHRRCKIRQNFPLDSEVKNFLSESGFSSQVGVSVPIDTSILPHNDEYIYKLRKFSWMDDYEIERIIDLIEKELKLSSLVRFSIHENLAELILNVEQHSKSPISCYILGQGYSNSHRIRFCIGDAGIGIKEHLGNKYRDLLSKNASEAISKALVEGVTGTTGNQNSGVGLSNFKDFIRCCGGSFMILSDDGLYEEKVGFMGRVVRKQKLDFCFPGTLIDFVIDSAPGKKIFHRKERIPKEYKLIK